MAIEAVRRIDLLFDIERATGGLQPGRRLKARDERARPCVAQIEAWLRGRRAKLPAKADMAKAIDYILKGWPSFVRFLDDGGICLTNNAAGARSAAWRSADGTGRRRLRPPAVAMYTLIETRKLNDFDPRAWLADVLARLPNNPASRSASACRGTGCRHRISRPQPDHRHRRLTFAVLAGCLPATFAMPGATRTNAIRPAIHRPRHRDDFGRRGASRPDGASRRAARSCREDCHSRRVAERLIWQRWCLTCRATGRGHTSFI